MFTAGIQHGSRAKPSILFSSFSVSDVTRWAGITPIKARPQNGALISSSQDSVPLKFTIKPGGDLLRSLFILDLQTSTEHYFLSTLGAS